MSLNRMIPQKVQPEARTASRLPYSSLLQNEAVGGQTPTIISALRITDDLDARREKRNDQQSAIDERAIVAEKEAKWAADLATAQAEADASSASWNDRIGELLKQIDSQKTSQSELTKYAADTSSAQEGFDRGSALYQEETDKIAQRPIISDTNRYIDIARKSVVEEEEEPNNYLDIAAKTLLPKAKNITIGLKKAYDMLPDSPLTPSAQEVPSGAGSIDSTITKVDAPPVAAEGPPETGAISVTGQAVALPLSGPTEAVSETSLSNPVATLTNNSALEARNTYNMAQEIANNPNRTASEVDYYNQTLFPEYQNKVAAMNERFGDVSRYVYGGGTRDITAGDIGSGIQSAYNVYTGGDNVLRGIKEGDATKIIPGSLQVAGGVNAELNTAGIETGGAGLGLGALTSAYNIGSGISDFATGQDKGRAAVKTGMGVLGALPVVQAVAPTALVGTGLSAIASAVPVIGYIAAAVAARDQWGNTSTPYEERNALQKFISTPATGILSALAGFGDSNSYSKYTNTISKGEEALIWEPLSKIFQGDIPGSLSEFREGLGSMPGTLASIALQTIFPGSPPIDTSNANPFSRNDISDEQKAWQSAMAVKEAAEQREAANVEMERLRSLGVYDPDAWIGPLCMYKDEKGWYADGGGFGRMTYNIRTPDPYSISTGSWLCTEIAKLMPVSVSELNSLSKLRRFAIKNHREESTLYFKNGKRLVEAIGYNPDEYIAMKKPLIEECVKEVEAGRMESANNKYMLLTKMLCEKLQVNLA